MKNRLTEQRAALQKIDEALLGLLTIRLRLNKDIGETKKSLHIDTDIPEIEKETIVRLVALAKGDAYLEKAITLIWPQLFLVSKEVQAAERGE